MTQPNKKDALGKGIRSLLQNIDADLKTTSGQLKSNVVESVTSMMRIPVEQIQVNPKQPRHDFDEEALSELAASIKLHDIVQPITVSQIGPNKYQLIAGERRWRATKIAGLKDIPAYVRHANDAQLLELALLENLQRQDLNAIEIGLSYKRMMDELGYTQEELAERMSRERSTVANFIRLLRLPPDIQLSVRRGEITMGHARALINVDHADKQLYIFNEIKKRHLSVRQTEDLVRAFYKSTPGVNNSAKNHLSPAFKQIEDKLASQFSTKIKVAHTKKGSGSITFEYNSLEELNSLLTKFNVQVH